MYEFVILKLVYNAPFPIKKSTNPASAVRCASVFLFLTYKILLCTKKQQLVVSFFTAAVYTPPSRSACAVKWSNQYLVVHRSAGALELQRPLPSHKLDPYLLLCIAVQQLQVLLVLRRTLLYILYIIRQRVSYTYTTAPVYWF